MKAVYNLTIPGAPRGQERHRHRVVSSAGRKPFTVEYKSAKQKEHEQLIRDSMVEFWGDRSPLEEALWLVVVAHMPIPKSWSKIKKQEAANSWHLSKPDYSNILKNIEDVGNGLLWLDDSQICLYANPGYVPRKTYSESPCYEIAWGEI